MKKTLLIVALLSGMSAYGLVPLGAKLSDLTPNAYIGPQVDARYQRLSELLQKRDQGIADPTETAEDKSDLARYEHSVRKWMASHR